MSKAKVYKVYMRNDCTCEQLSSTVIILIIPIMNNLFHLFSRIEYI